MRSKRFITFIAFLVCLGALAKPVAPVHAWDMTLTKCTEGDLNWALTLGGTVKFGIDCTIYLTHTIILNNSTTIDGNGYNVTIHGPGSDRVIYLNYFVGYDTAQTLKNLTIEGGNYGDGGGVYVDNSNTTITNVTFKNNNATRGGAIYVKGSAAANVSNSTFSSNVASTDGGAIFVEGGGRATISYSIFGSNSATNRGGSIFIDPEGYAKISYSTFTGNKAGELLTGDGKGGAIYNFGMLNENTEVTNSEFTDNSAKWGGAIFTDRFLDYSGILNVSNCTFSGNHSFYGGGISVSLDATTKVNSSTFYGNTAADGGGIFVWGGGTATVRSSTFSGNNATQGGSGIYNYSGIYGNGTVYLANTIIANSLYSTTNCHGTIIDNGGNLSSDQTCQASYYADPLLGPLQDNGGPTFTMALPFNSPAIDKGVTWLCQATSDYDQRGQPRYVDGNRDRVADCDIGAFELAPHWSFLPLLTK